MIDTRVERVARAIARRVILKSIEAKDLPNQNEIDALTVEEIEAGIGPAVDEMWRSIIDEARDAISALLDSGPRPEQRGAFDLLEAGKAAAIKSSFGALDEKNAGWVAAQVLQAAWPPIRASIDLSKPNPFGRAWTPEMVLEYVGIELTCCNVDMR